MEKKLIKFTIDGEPIAQQRHRHRTFANKAGNTTVRTYDPSHDKKVDFFWIVRENAPNEPITGPIALRIDCYFPRPKSHFGTGKNSNILKESAPKWHTSKPDIDNVFKFITDALSLQGLFWKDDSLICAIRTTKQYSTKPRIEITIAEL